MSFGDRYFVILLVVSLMSTVHVAGMNLTNNSPNFSQVTSIGSGNISDVKNQSDSTKIAENLTVNFDNSTIGTITNNSRITGNITDQISNNTSSGIILNNSKDNLDDVFDLENTSASSVAFNETPGINTTLPGSETILTPGNTIDSTCLPALKGSQVEWIESLQNTYWIKVFDLSTLRELTIPLNKTLLSAVPPSLDSGRIAFYEEVNNSQRIFIYNTSSREKTYIPSEIQGENQLYPSFDAENIVYLDDRAGVSDVYLYNLTTCQGQILSKYDNGYTHYSPSISGNYVIWFDEKDGKIGIYLYNIALASGSLIVNDTQDMYYFPPSIDGNTIVWEDWRNQNFDIYSYNITSKTETLLTPDTNDSDQMSPSLSGNRVVYEDWMTGKGRIFLLNTTSGQRYQVSYTSNGDQRSPRIDGNRIVWQDSRNGYLNDIYLFTVGETRPQLVSNFFANSTIGNVPMTVQFSDASSGSPSAYLWDFGDGNCSDARNPVHTYYTSGIYTVELKVSTAWSRDAKVMTDFITARSAPTASFSAAPPSGAVPLTVVFHDTSTGQPNWWSWDFGDNSTSGERNPSHTYYSSGNYSVRLVCGNQFGNTSTWNYVMVVPATIGIYPFKIPGEVSFSSDTGFIVINESSENNYQYIPSDNWSQITVLPEHGGTDFIRVLVSDDGKGFTQNNGTITGNLSSMRVISSDLDSPVSSALPGSRINVSIEINNYRPDSALDIIISNLLTTEEYQKYTSVIWDRRYADSLNAVACIANFTFENTANTGPATITMATSHDWVVKNSQFIMPADRFRVGVKDSKGNFTAYNTLFDYSDPVNNLDYYTVSYPIVFNISDLYIIQYNSSLSLADSGMKIIDPADPGILYTNSALIAVDSDWVKWNDPGIWDTLYEPVTILHIDDNGNGEVLNTTHLYYDPVKNLDVFEADSPNGLSEFALTTVSRSGNPFQLLYLSILSRISPSSSANQKPKSPPINYGGGGGGGGSYGGDGSLITSSPSTGSSSTSGTSSTDAGSTGALSSPQLSNPAVSGISAKSPYVSAPNPAQTGGVPMPKSPQGTNIGGFVVQIPNSSVFSLFIEAAAMISVVLLVVFSMFTRYRRKDKD